MIHNVDYVKGLMRKRFAGSISPMESALLREARKMYDDEEWLRMTADALKEMDREQEGGLPKGKRLDLTAIRQRADRKRRGASWSATGAKIMAAAVLLAVIAWAMKKYRIDRVGPLELYGNCSDLGSGTIPEADFEATIGYGNAAPIAIDANVQGHIAQVGNVSIDRDSTGRIRITAFRDAVPSDTVGHAEIRVFTKAGQQCEVRLPDGTRVRLNMGSVLTYPLLPREQGINLVQINGEAHVQVPQQQQGVQAVLETGNSWLFSSRGDFAITSSGNQTYATLLDGELLAVSKNEKRRTHAKRRGDRINVVTTTTLTGQPADAMVPLHHHDVAGVLQWTKVARVYRNVPMRDFIRDRGRWYGVTFTDMGCIPKSKRISVSMCYRATLDDFLAVIEKEGIRVYRTNGQYSFCKPKNNKEQRYTGVAEGFGNPKGGQQ